MTASATDATQASPGSTPPDYHIHTVLCKHASGFLSEYRRTAARRGMTEMCFTDHVPSPTGYDPTNRMELEQFPLYRDMVRELRDDAEPRVFFGIEADYYPQCEEFLAPWLPKQPFDLVLGSVHYIGNWGFDNPAERKKWDSADVEGVWRAYFALVVKLVATGLFDVLSHFDLPKKFGHRLAEAPLRELVQPVLDRVAQAGLAIELNTSGLRRPVGEIYPSPLILALARERGIPICFGSDAHRPEEVGAAFDQAVQLAREAGYTEQAVYCQRQRTSRPLPPVR